MEPKRSAVSFAFLLFEETGVNGQVAIKVDLASVQGTGLVDILRFSVL
jgi:hypothetical protein